MLQALTDSHIPDLSEEVLQRLKLYEEHVGVHSKSQQIDNTSDTYNPEVISEDVDLIPEEDWSLATLFKSALLDDSMNPDHLTDRIMESLDLESLRENEIAEMETADVSLLQALESELNTTLDELSASERSISPSSMSFEHEIPDPVIAQKGHSMMEFVQESLIEFTEEEEFTLQRKT